MNYCTKCGAKLEEDSNFCVKCGSKIEREEVKEQGILSKESNDIKIEDNRQEFRENTYQESRHHNNTTSGINNMSNDKKIEKKKMKTRDKIMIIGLMVICSIIALWNISDMFKDVISEINNDKKPNTVAGKKKDKKEGEIVLTRGNEWIYVSQEDIYKGEKTSKEVDLDDDGVMETITIGRDHPNGLMINLSSGEYGLNASYDVSTKNSSDEFGELSKGYGVQVTCYDLDNNGIKEVLVSIGDGTIEMTTAIYSYNPQKKEVQFLIDGTIEGEKNMSIEKNGNIKVPLNIAGRVEEYKYKDGKLTNIKGNDKSSNKSSVNKDDELLEKVESEHREVTFIPDNRSLTFTMSQEDAMDIQVNSGTVTEDFVNYCLNLSRDYNLEYLKSLIRIDGGGDVPSYLLGIEIVDNELTYVYGRDKEQDEIRNGS